MFSIEKRGAAVADSSPNPRVIEPTAKPTTQQRKQDLENFTEADLTQLRARHKRAAI
jgi:hypothetical protein